MGSCPDTNIDPTYLSLTSLLRCHLYLSFCKGVITLFKYTHSVCSKLNFIMLCLHGFDNKMKAE